MYGLLVPAGVDPATVEILERFAEYMVGVVARVYSEGDPDAYEAEAEEDVREELRYFLRFELDGIPATPLQRPARRKGRARNT